MARTSFFLALAFCTSQAHSFPAPKPTEAPTNAELIVGLWQIVQIGEKLVEPDGRVYEFTNDGRGHWRRAGDEYVLTKTCRYRVDNSVLVLGSSDWHIQSLTPDKLVIEAGEGNAILEFRRRR